MHAGKAGVEKEKSRADKIRRARELIADPSYPSDKIITAAARRLAKKEFRDLPSRD